MLSIALSLCALLTAALAVSPPSSLAIIIPKLPSSGINIGTVIPLGFSDEDKDNNTYWGLHRIVNVTVTYPNGMNRTIARFGSFNDSSTGCQVFPGNKLAGTFQADQNGTYTAQWNITYGISSTPSQINKTSNNCGPGPLSFQSFILEYKFDVNGTRTLPALKLPQATETRNFGSEVTGEVGGLGSSGDGGNGGTKTSVNIMMIPVVALIGGIVLKVV
ncbi:hypothetical protein V5O48_001447 [Marasmius crinis-equi]|uniref:Uncharacterized protein n=1 Tax=Marasmius crinis-equi TaxID=585013 RepID=A0ABR3FZI2_9AGAR